MYRFLIKAALCGFFVARAHADAIGLHGFSDHFRDGPNNENIGAFYRHEGWEVGGYYNSRRNSTLYAGYLFEYSELSLFGRAWRPGLFVGIATGYSKPLIPAATVSASTAITGRWRLRLEYTHDPTVHTPGVLHTRLEYEF